MYVSGWVLVLGSVFRAGVILYYILYYTLLLSSSFLLPILLSSSSSHLLLIQSIRVGTYIYLFIFYQYSIIPNIWPRMFYRSGWLRCVGFISMWCFKLCVRDSGLAFVLAFELVLTLGVYYIIYYTIIYYIILLYIILLLYYYTYTIIHYIIISYTYYILYYTLLLNPFLSPLSFSIPSFPPLISSPFPILSPPNPVIYLPPILSSKNNDSQIR